MKQQRIPLSFFTERTTLRLARDLLGCTLVHEGNDGTVAGLITETEAYTERDPASHTFGGTITKRNATMFQPAGRFYVYLIYGMYLCCNIVAEQEGTGCAVLLRSVIPTEGIELMRKRRGTGNGLADGPGKLCQAFGITRQHDGLDLSNPRSPLYLATGSPVKSVTRTPRIGISAATEKMWRFVAGREDMVRTVN